MKVTVEFASLEEFQKYMGILPSAPSQTQEDGVGIPEPPKQEPDKTPQEAPEKPKKPTPEKNTRKAEKPSTAEADPEQCTAEEPQKVTEDFRIVVRKQLAALNKKCGYNRAAELIKELTGKDKLTEVELADLPKLMDKAKEETNAE